MVSTWHASTVPAGPPAQQLNEVITQVEMALSAQVTCDKQEVLRKWTTAMHAQGAQATQWLKGSIPAQPNAVQVTREDGSTYVTNDLQDTFDAITNFWQQIWQRNAECEELPRLRSNTLTRPPGPAMQDDWHLQPSELHALAQHNSGAAGPDGGAIMKCAICPSALGRSS